MQTRAKYLSLALHLCCACTAREREHALDEVQTDASAVDAQLAEDARVDVPATMDAQSSDASPQSDAGTTDARSGALDTGAVDATTSDGSEPQDACTSDVCAPGPRCDPQHPCSAPDTQCIQGSCVPDPATPPSDWQQSAWSGRVGVVREDDTTLWCTPTLTQGGASGPAHLRGELQEVALHGARKERVTAPQLTQRLRVQCFADAELKGTSSLIGSGWSRDEEQDQTSLTCPPDRPFAGFARCQLASQGKPPLVYAGPSCGDGVSGLSGKANLRGQLLGDKYELSPPGKPLFNNTAAAAVTGTDLGFQFLAQGRMYLGFGDTWENETQTPGPNGYRGSVLAYTHDFEPADENGIAFEGWETAPEKPGIAREVIACPHDMSGATEATAIATAGFGLSEGAGHHRLLWFAAIKSWFPFVTNESTLAWSENGAPFVRGDQAPTQHPPRWPFDSYFGPGAIWVDRLDGYIYFFGVRTYQPGNPVRLARVRATLAAARDHLQYEYWTGQEYRRPDPRDEYALARLADPAADLIRGSAQQNTRPELSVSYNPYVGRFLMLVHNDATFLDSEPKNHFQIWQAEKLEGPWSLAETGDALVLSPNLYGPYHSEQTFSNGGQDLHFLLSDWNVLPSVLGQPYVVGLWNVQLTRRVRAGCTP